MKTLFGTFFVMAAGVVLMGALGLYISGSLLVSIAKLATGSCGQTWPVEKLLVGDWMCVDK